MSFTATTTTEALTFTAATIGLLPMMLLADPQLIAEPMPIAVIGMGLFALFGVTRRRGGE